MSDAEKLADEHWAYVGGVCEKMYKDAFVHGYKHGKDDKDGKEEVVCEKNQPVTGRCIYALVSSSDGTYQCELSPTIDSWSVCTKEFAEREYVRCATACARNDLLAKRMAKP